MREHLTPATELADCIEVHLATHQPRGTILYLCILGVIIAGVAALPFIRVPITAQADGMLRPVIDRHDVRTIDGGTIASVRTRDGATVTAGDTLLVLVHEALSSRLATIDSLIAVSSADLRDLDILALTPLANLTSLHLATAHREQQRRERAHGLRERATRLYEAQRTHARIRQLHSHGFATSEQLEAQSILERTASAAIDEYEKRAHTEWAEARATRAAELLRLSADRADVMAALQQRTVRAPVSGTVELTAHLSPGSVVGREERVATISPDTLVHAEAYVSARDVGFVARGTDVRLLIDAFNYREWGVAHAEVVDVASDASMVSDRPAFRVRCRLQTQYLQTRRGARARLRKGMTFRARFVLAERSLMQLLFDRTDAWLNPAQAPTIAHGTR